MNNPQSTHRVEQGAAALRDIAALLGAFRGHLIVEGFSQEEALELCKVHLQVFMTGANQKVQTEIVLKEVLPALLKREGGS